MFLAFHLLAFFSRGGSGRFAKIRAGVIGRAALFDELSTQLRQIENKKLRFWIHAASMGEYEQARPLLQEIGQRMPGAARILTFFSPSAYDNINRANIPAEVVSYLPFDSLWNARRFLEMTKPVAGIIIRHDFWPNHLWEAKRRGVFLLLADASVSANARSLRHRPIVRHFNRALFDCFEAICAVSTEARQSLLDLVRSPERLIVTGDSRYDQVLFRSRAKKVDELLPQGWENDAAIFVAGSTWPSDEAVLLPAFVQARIHLPALRMILVPHEPTPHHLADLERQLANHELPSARLSQLQSENQKKGGDEAEKVTPRTPVVLLVDRVGMLANLYGAGQVAFVGGSFGPGVHNVLEAAIHGVPVMVGPRFHNSPEALELVERKLLNPITHSEDCLQTLLKLFRDSVRREQIGKASREFVLAKCGASAKIIEILMKHLPAAEVARS